MQAEASLRFRVILEKDLDDGLWVAYVPSLGQLSTYGETREDALKWTREAISGYLEAARKLGFPISHVPRAIETEILELEVATP